MTISKTTKINILLSIALLLVCESKIIISHLFYSSQIQTPFNIWFIGTILIGSFLENFILFLLSNTLILIITKNKLNSSTYKIISFLIIFLITFLKSISPSASRIAFVPIYCILIINIVTAIISTLIYTNNKNSKPLLISTMYASIITIITIAFIPIINSIY